MEMSDDFRQRIVEGYKEDDWYARVIKQINNNNALAEDAIFLPFIRGRPTPPLFYRPIEVPIEVTTDHTPPLFYRPIEVPIEVTTDHVSSTVPINESTTDRTVESDVTTGNDPAQSNRAASQSYDLTPKDNDLLFYIDRVTGH